MMLGGSYVLMVYKYMYSVSNYPGKFQSYCHLIHVFLNITSVRYGVREGVMCGE